MRGRQSTETDLLNGEIVLLGAEHGVATPLEPRGAAPSPSGGPGRAPAGPDHDRRHLPEALAAGAAGV